MRLRRIACSPARASVLFFFLVVVAAPATASADDYSKGEVCGGLVGKGCPTDMFCQDAPGTCKVSDNQGTCVPVPTICNKIFMPVCGCNGKTYGNDCERQAAKVSKDHDGECTKS